MYRKVLTQLGDPITLVAVSKIKPVEDIQAMYDLGQRDFGENYVQELCEKQPRLPADIRWHFIGHLQSNKVKYISPFVYMIQGVDSLKLLQEISKQAIRQKRVINCLLQVHIAREETKFGYNETELDAVIQDFLKTPLPGVFLRGLMGMATFTDDLEKVRAEYKYLKSLFNKYLPIQQPHFHFEVLSMGMSADYLVAKEEGSTMVRIGSLIFGKRVYPNKLPG